MTPDQTGLSALALENVIKVRERGGVCFELTVERMELSAGQFVALVGPSGSGKSTLLDLMGLVLRPDRVGRFVMHVGGPEPLNLAEADETYLADIRRRHIGYVLQTGGLLPFLTVRQNIMLPGRLCRQVDVKASTQRLAKRLGISDQLDKKPAFLSGGQRQRAAIARALVHQPWLVLADEPTAAVDQLNARQIVNEFKSLTSRMGVTVVMVTHDLPLVAEAADRIFQFDLKMTGGQNARAFLRERPVVCGKSERQP